jgi:hypothetical protein
MYLLVLPSFITFAYMVCAPILKILEIYLAIGIVPDDLRTDSGTRIRSISFSLLLLTFVGEVEDEDGELAPR